MLLKYVAMFRTRVTSSRGGGAYLGADAGDEEVGLRKHVGLLVEELLAPTQEVHHMSRSFNSTKF